MQRFFPFLTESDRTIQKGILRHTYKICFFSFSLANSSAFGCKATKKSFNLSNNKKLLAKTRYESQNAKFESLKKMQKSWPTKALDRKLWQTVIKVKNSIFLFLHEFFATFSTDSNHHKILRFLYPYWIFVLKKRTKKNICWVLHIISTFC